MIAVVIPCFKVKAHILSVLEGIGPEVSAIFVVDDACPDGSGDFVEQNIEDPRVRVVRHAENRGVGGATLSGYRAAIEAGATAIVKMDGDGQMDPTRIPQLVRPILEGDADYAKGNRFFDLDGLKDMPFTRLVGNSILSFVNKVSSGYWDLFDPTNGYTAIHARVASELPFDKISQRYFFESDLLFRLNTLRAVVWDIPMPARYGSEQSNLLIERVAPEFLIRHIVNTFKRVFYGYFLRSFSLASVQLVLGFFSFVFGSSIGAHYWRVSIREETYASAGTVMLAALPVIIGVQLILAFLSYDMQNIPRNPIHRRLEGEGPSKG